MRAVLFLCLAATLPAQDGVTIRVDVQQVLVPVVVTDKKGHHITGLRAADFQIFEDGTPQKIASFTTDTAAAVNDVNALAKAAEPVPSPGPRRTFVICIDTLHTSPANAARMREALEALFSKEKIGDAQYVLIGIGRELQVLQPATTNPLAILQKLRGPAFQAMMSGLDSSALASELFNLRSRMEDFCKHCACSVGRSVQQSCDSQVETLKQSVDEQAARWTSPAKLLVEQFTNVVRELSKLPTGRTLILASDGFNVNPLADFYAVVAAFLPGRPQFTLPNSAPVAAEALKIAADRNVIIYAVDTRGGAAPSLANFGSMDAGSSGSGANASLTGLNGRNGPSVRTTSSLGTTAQLENPFQPADSSTMQQLAKETGGVYLHDPTNLTKDFHDAIADGREYYIIAYIPKNSAQDGKYRRISVETSNKSLTVRTKPGYWAASSAQ